MNSTDVDEVRQLLDSIEPTCQYPDLETGQDCTRRADWIAWFVHRVTGADTRRFLQCDPHKQAQERHERWCPNCGRWRLVTTPLRGER